MSSTVSQRLCFVALLFIESMLFLSFFPPVNVNKSKNVSHKKSGSVSISIVSRMFAYASSPRKVSPSQNVDSRHDEKENNMKINRNKDSQSRVVGVSQQELLPCQDDNEVGNCVDVVEKEKENEKDEDDKIVEIVGWKAERNNSEEKNPMMTTTGTTDTTAAAAVTAVAGATFFTRPVSVRFTNAWQEAHDEEMNMMCGDCEY